MPSSFAVTASVNRDPQTGGMPATRGSGRFSYTATRNLPRRVGAEGVVVTGTDAAPQALPMAGHIVRGRLLVLAVYNGEVRVRVTTPDGATQVFPVTGLMLIDNPTDGSEFTAITIAATPFAAPAIEVEYEIGGDGGGP